MEKEKIKFPFKCPVCGKEEFTNLEWFINDAQDDNVETYELDQISGKKVIVTDPIKIHFVHCSYCGWIYDLKQVTDYDAIGDRNNKTVNELKQDYQNKLKDNPKYNFDEENSKHVPHKCPICGEHQFKCVTSYDVCPICGWIDDGTEDDPFNDYSEVNVASINDAKEEFTKNRQLNPKYKYKSNNK